MRLCNISNKFVENKLLRHFSLYIGFHYDYDFYFKIVITPDI